MSLHILLCSHCETLRFSGPGMPVPRCFGFASLQHSGLLYDLFRELCLERDLLIIRYQQEDSTLLWKHIISNPLLKNTQIVLFLNKIDLFKGGLLWCPHMSMSMLNFWIDILAKLEAGVRFGHYVVSYGDRPNEYEAAAACA